MAWTGCRAWRLVEWWAIMGLVLWIWAGTVEGWSGWDPVRKGWWKEWCGAGQGRQRQWWGGTGDDLPPPPLQAQPG